MRNRMHTTKTRDNCMPENSQFQHIDRLAFLNQEGTLSDKLTRAHKQIQETLPFIARISLALYDKDTKVLKTFLHSSNDDDPLSHYETLIDNAPSLKEILNKGHPRVINTLPKKHHKNAAEHTQRISKQGYNASYTIPMYDNGTFIGFVFFNSYECEVFTEHHLHEIDLYAHLIALMVINELTTIHTLTAVVKTSGNLTHYRDPETGSHLDRMSRYTRLIAKEISGKHKLNDDYIEHVFMFSPLHDIGKIAIPDNILLKPGKLDEDEMAIMKSHTLKGRQIIDHMLENFGLENIDNTNILRNIATFHHEAVNGTGYPIGKMGEEIPLEARIVAVADIFDALTSHRPYKEAWSNKDAFDLLTTLAGETLDEDCVNALLTNEAEIVEIQKRFKEKTL